MWWFYALLSALFAALTAVFAKAGVAGVSSNLATAIRTVVIVLLTWGIVFAQGEQKGLPLLSRRNLLFLVFSGIATGLSWIFYFKSLETGKVSQVASIDKLSVVFVIILSVIFLGDTLNLKTTIGAVCIIAGAIIIIS